MIGSYMGTDKSYTPIFIKCVISKNMISDEEKNEVRELLAKISMFMLNLKNLKI